MSMNVPGWIPGAPDHEDVPPCERCLHRASAHHDAKSCSARGRWGQGGWRCCSGYTRFDATTPLAAPPRSPVDR